MGVEKAEAEVAAGVEKAAKAEEQGYRRGCEESVEVLRKVLMTLAPDFQEDSYFEAYIHYAEERQRAEAEGRDTRKTEFIPPSSEGDDPEAEGTTPLDDEAGTPDDEDHGNEREPDA